MRSVRTEHFLTQLATLVGAGVPLAHGLTGLARTETGAARDVIAGVADDLARGETLSGALARHPRTFDPLSLALVRTGETTGRLDDCLHLAATAAARARRSRNRLGLALLYPLIVAHVGVIAANIVVLVTSDLATFLARVLGTLVPAYAAVAVGYVLHGRLRDTEGYGRFVMRLPVIGNINARLALARFARSLASLNSAGVGAGEALRLASDTTGNGAVAVDGKAAARRLGRGQGLGQALEPCTWIPPMLREMIATGETAGELPKMLAAVATYADDEAEQATRTLSIVLPIAVLVLVGIYVGWIVVGFLASYFGQLGNL